MKKIVSALLLLPLLFSCSLDQDPPKDFTASNEKEIIDYLEKNQLTATRTESGLYYTIENQGDGLRPDITSRVTVAYKGYFTNGNIFDQSSDQGIPLYLSQVIKGWTEGIRYFNEGGSGKLFIPAHLGYGSYPVMGIPAGSVLIFDIKLLKVE